jgi:hypothetical protein
MFVESEEDILKTREERKLKRKERKKERRERRADRTAKENSELNNIPFKKSISVDSDVQANAIFLSIKQNFIFYIVLVGCLYAFTKCQHNKSSFVLSILTIGFITFYGYVMHYLSHCLNNTMSEVYKTYDNVFTRNKYIDWCANKLIYFTEFHATTHHDIEINKQYKNIGLEFLNNIATQGVLLLIVKYFLNILDNRTILLWAFFYATVHNINYLYVKPSTHKEHHIDDKTNYGIDIWDIIVGSKYDWNNIETHNHTAINLIVITAVIMYFSKKLNL